MPQKLTASLLMQCALKAARRAEHVFWSLVNGSTKYVWGCSVSTNTRSQPVGMRIWHVRACQPPTRTDCCQHLQVLIRYHKGSVEKERQCMHAKAHSQMRIIKHMLICAPSTVTAYIFQPCMPCRCLRCCRCSQRCRCSPSPRCFLPASRSSPDNSCTMRRLRTETGHPCQHQQTAGE